MLLKCAILGLVLLLVGGFAYGWVHHEMRAEQQAQSSGLSYSLAPEEYLNKYGRWYTLTPEQQNQLVLELDGDRQGKTREELAKEQQARLRADLDKLAADQMHPGDIADFLYGPGWENEVEQYKKRKEKMEIAQTISVVCLGIGGTLSGLCVVIGVLWFIVHIFTVLRRRSSRRPSEPEPNVPELTNIEPHPPVTEPEPPPERPRQRRRVLALSDTAGDSHLSSSAPQEPATANEFLTSTFSGRAGASPPSFGVQAETDDGAVAVLLADEQTGEKEWSADVEWTLQGGLAVPRERAPQATAVVAEPATPAAPYEEKVAPVESTLKEHADDLQKQIAEFKQMAQDVQQTTREQSQPLTSTLKELAQQVSAIRDYAASQQGRVEKLQDGYDWGIIRTFCLKVIRCIDNLESRITDSGGDDDTATHLEEVKDELLFALESSGIEQFQPEINSEYRGQEKLAEAIKDKQPGKNPDQAGRIAKVLRPGYRYMVDDENFKVVRTAQVKLFG